MLDCIDIKESEDKKYYNKSRIIQMRFIIAVMRDTVEEVKKD